MSWDALWVHATEKGLNENEKAWEAESKVIRKKKKGQSAVRKSNPDGLQEG